MTTLIYKRTHRGDPNPQGVFGCNDCMGRVRSWAFDAAIGVGGKHPDGGHEDLAFKITWVGIHARRTPARGRGPLVEFEHFVLWEDDGPDIRQAAPHLFRYMFQDRHVRAVLSTSLPRAIQKEIQEILMHAHDDDATAGRRTTGKRRAQSRKPGKRQTCKSHC